MPLTKEQFPEVMSYIGLDPEKIESVDKFKEEYSKTFIKKDPLVIKSDPDLMSKVVGSLTGSIKTRLEQAWKKAGFEWDDTLVKDKPIEKAIEEMFTTATTSYSEKIKTLEDSSKLGGDAATKDWQEKYSKLENDVKQKDLLLKTAKEQYDNEKNQWTEKEKSWASEKKSTKKNQLTEKLWNDYQWASGLDELTKEGFISTINKNFKLELTEDESDLDIFDTAGNRVPNPSKHATFYKPAEVLVQKGIEKKVYAINPNPKGSPPTKNKTPEKQEPAKQDRANARRVVNSLIPGR